MPPTIDILAIGALNIDRIFYVTISSALRSALSAICPQIAWGGETLVDEEIFIEIGKVLNRQPTHVQLGGSAYNALRAANAIGLGQRLGFIGSAGEEPAAAGFFDWFERNHISVPFTTRARGLLTGGCISLEDRGERTLLTTRGANDRTSDMLAMNMAAVAAWASSASMVHLSSFLDDRSPAVLAEFLGSCRDRNPSLRVTIDPGAHWAARHADDSSIQELLGRADLLFVNQQEFDAIWGGGEQPPGDRSRRVRTGNGPSVAILLKRPERLTLFDRTGAVLKDVEHIRLTKDELVNTTGAGDVLAGAYLAGLQDPRLTTTRRLAAATAVVGATLRGGRSAEPQLASIFRSAAGLSS